MATLSTCARSGRRTIQFKAGGSVRKSIRLGKVSMRHAQRVKHHVEDLVSAAGTGGSYSPETSAWLMTIDDDLRAKLEGVGLVISSGKRELGPFLDELIERRSSLVKASTLVRDKQTVRELRAFFGDERRLVDVSEGDAEDFRAHLLGKRGLSENTVRKHSGRAREWFGKAVKRRIIESNPFSGLPTRVRGSENTEYVPADVALAVLDELHPMPLRLIFVLSRFAGLRVGSEVRRLKWGHIEWDRERFTVESPKTEHHEGHAPREVPLFPMVAHHLREAFEQAEPGQDFVIPWLQGRTDASVANLLKKAIKRIGREPWGRVWHSLRASCQTDLEDQGNVSHVVCRWMGNSEAVAREHYLQVTDGHWAKAVQNPVQQVLADHCKGAYSVGVPILQNPDCSELRKIKARCGDTEPVSLITAGLEPATC